MKDNAYAIVTQNVSPICSITNNNQLVKYRALIQKLLKLEPYNWPKFQE